MTDFTGYATPGRKPSRADPIDAMIGTGLARSILDSSPDCIMLIGLEGTLLYTNQNGLSAMEIDDASHVRGRYWPSLWPRNTRDLLENAIEDARLGSRSIFDAYCPTVYGASRWWSVNVAPVRGNDGSVLYICATSRDITVQITSEQSLRDRDIQLQDYAESLTAELRGKEVLIERQQVLNAEIDHRVKNSFALIGSILRMKMRTMTDGEAREALGDAANRIAILSRVHEQLHCDVEAQTVSLAPYLDKLATDLADTLTNRSDVVLAEAIDLDLSSERAVAIGLVTSELVSNALKHRQSEDSTLVTITLREAKGGNSVTLRVADTGDGLPEGFDLDECNGLGMQICKTYSQMLDGTLTAESIETGGAAFSLTFPKVRKTEPGFSQQSR